MVCSGAGRRPAHWPWRGVRGQTPSLDRGAPGSRLYGACPCAPSTMLSSWPKRLIGSVPEGLISPGRVRGGSAYVPKWLNACGRRNTGGRRLHRCRRHWGARDAPDHGRRAPLNARAHRPRAPALVPTATTRARSSDAGAQGLASSGPLPRSAWISPKGAGSPRRSGRRSGETAAIWLDPRRFAAVANRVLPRVRLGRQWPRT